MDASVALFERPEFAERTPRELAELVWLAMQWVGEELPRDEAYQPVSLDDEEIAHKVPSKIASPPAPSIDAAFDAIDPERRVTTPAGEGNSYARETRWADRLPALPDRLLHARALHRLAPVRLEPERTIIDIENSAKLTAATRALQLVVRPATTNRARLILLVDRAGQMAPWRRVIEEYTALAIDIGEFRSVESVEMDASDPSSVRFRVRGLETDLGRVARPGMDHVCLILSDGVGLAFRSGALGRALRRLPAGSRSAWVHPWPERFWWRSAYGRLQLAAPLPVTSRSSSVAVPIVELDPRALAGLESWVQERAAGAVRAVAVPAWEPSQGKPVPPPARVLDEPARLRRLVGSLQPLTVRLLALAAVVPGRVDLELLIALGRQMGVVGRYEIAEAIGAGVFERIDRDDTVVLLRFISPAARDVFSGYLPEDELERIFRFVISHCERSQGNGADRARTLQIPIGILRRVLDSEESLPGSTDEEQGYEGVRVLTAMLPDVERTIAKPTAQRAKRVHVEDKFADALPKGSLREPYDDPKLLDRARAAVAALSLPNPETSAIVREFARALVFAMQREVEKVERDETPPRAEKIRSRREFRERLAAVGVRDVELQDLAFDGSLAKRKATSRDVAIYGALPRWLTPLRMQPASPEHVERVRTAFNACSELWTTYRALLDAAMSTKTSKLEPSTVTTLLGALGKQLTEEQLSSIAVERAVEWVADVDTVIHTLHLSSRRPSMRGSSAGTSDVLAVELRAGRGLARVLRRLLADVLARATASIPALSDVLRDLDGDLSAARGLAPIASAQLETLQRLQEVLRNDEVAAQVLRRVGRDGESPRPSAPPEIHPIARSDHIVVHVGANARAAAIELDAPPPERGWRRLVTAADLMQRDQREWKLWVRGPMADFDAWRALVPAVKSLPLARGRQVYQSLSTTLGHMAGRGLLVMPRVTRVPVVTFLPDEVIPSDTFIIFPGGNFALLGLLQSRAFLAWANTVTTGIRDVIQLTPHVVRCFPPPRSLLGLEGIGRELDGERKRVCADEGLSLGRLWRSVADEESPLLHRRLRELRDELDRAVLRAYGWDDIKLDDLTEISNRLIELNHKYA